MAPPAFGDLGKSCRDVFGKGYHFGLIKLDVKSKTATGLEFNSTGQSALESSKVNGSFEAKYKCKDYGITATEKWSTDNQLTGTLEVQDQGLKGLKLAVDANFSAETGAKSGKFKAEMKHDAFAANADVDIKASPIVNGSIVFGHQGWLAGYKMAFDTSKSKLTKNHFGLGYSAGDLAVHTSVQDGQVFDATVYNKCNSNLETGVTIGWASQNNATNFGVGCKYALDRDSSIRARVNNASQVGLGYQQRIRPGITMTLSTLIDGKNFNQGGHKIGLALELEA